MGLRALRISRDGRVADGTGFENTRHANSKIARCEMDARE